MDRDGGYVKSLVRRCSGGSGNGRQLPWCCTTEEFSPVCPGRELKIGEL